MVVCQGSTARAAKEATPASARWLTVLYSWTRAAPLLFCTSPLQLEISNRTALSPGLMTDLADRGFSCLDTARIWCSAFAAASALPLVASIAS